MIPRDSLRCADGTWLHATVGTGGDWHAWARTAELGLRVSMFLKGIEIKGFRS